jgi:hypothetical protein
MPDNRPIVYREGDITVYRASSVGLPARCLVAARQDYDPLPPPDYLVQAAEAGSSIEAVVKAMLRVQGFKVTGEQTEINLEVLPNVVVRGHLDAGHAIAPDTTEDRMLEVKSMSPRVFDEWMKWGFEHFYTYAAQVSCYMAALQAQAVYAVVNRETYDLDVRILDDYPVPFAEIVDHLSMVEAYATTGTLPKCTGAKYRCPFDYLCDAHEPQFEEIEAGAEATLIDLGNQYASILDLEADLKSRKASIAADVKVALAGRDSISVPGFSFSHKSQTRRSLDTTRLRKHMGKLLDEFYVDKETAPQLRVTRKGHSHE